MSVKGRVAASQDPLLVKMGVRSWNARRVPVGRRFARFAVLVRVCESARRDRDVDRDGGFEVARVVVVGVVEVGEVEASADEVGGCCCSEVVLGLCLRDIFFWNMKVENFLRLLPLMKSF